MVGARLPNLFAALPPSWSWRPLAITQLGILGQLFRASAPCLYQPTQSQMKHWTQEVSPGMRQVSTRGHRKAALGLYQPHDPGQVCLPRTAGARPGVGQPEGDAWGATHLGLVDRTSA